MKKYMVSMISSILIPSGCYGTSGTLDTTHLEKESKGASSGMPMIYTAKNIDEALKAIPFRLRLPSKLPFKTKKGYTDGYSYKR